MLSKKMAFSLTSLITIFALAFVVPSAMAVDFEVMIEGQRVVTYEVDDQGDAPDAALDAILVTVTSEEALPDPLVAVDANGDGMMDPGDSAGNLILTTRDERGFETTGSPAAAAAAGISATIGGVAFTGVTVEEQDIDDFPDRSVKLRRLSVVITPGTPITLEQVTITIPAFETPDVRVDANHDWSPGASHTILVRDEDDVDLDEDDAQVVSIQRLRPGSQTAVAAFQDEEISPDPFDIRVVLTESRFTRIDYAEKTPDELAEELIEVGGGKVSDLRPGVPFSRLRRRILLLT